MKLVKYEAARQALAVATRVDEVKAIRDKAVAMQVYAKQAKDRELIAYATEYRLRAERRAGEMLKELSEKGERAKVGSNQYGSDKKVLPLAKLGVTRKQSSRWQKLAKLAKQKFEALIFEATQYAADVVDRVEVQGDKKRRRTQREKELGKKQRALPQQKFGVIYADPPWKFEPYSRETGMDRAADNHYPTMDTVDISTMKIPTANDCILFLWATAPMLPAALEVMNDWGFEYRTHFIWAKDKAGMGYWNRNKHELLLVGVCGKIPAPAPGEQFPSLIPASRGKHSTKPDVFRKMIEKLFPTLPKLELFARENHKGWSSFGNEIEGEEFKEAAE